MTEEQWQLAMCAKINFENLERASPHTALHPYYRIAKAQLDEALGGMPVDEKFKLDLQRCLKKSKDLEEKGFT